MTDEPAAGAAEQPGDPAVIDMTRPHQARIYDYWLGGKDNYAVDREAAERALAAYPGLRRGVRAQRTFLASVVGYLAGTAGVRQFLDIGTGIPTASNTHEVAQVVVPAARIVYVDNDPVVLAHARALLNSSRQGMTSYLDADLRDTAKILTGAAALLDFRKPVGVLLIGVLQLIGDADSPHAIVARQPAGRRATMMSAMDCPTRKRLSGGGRSSCQAVRFVGRSDRSVVAGPGVMSGAGSSRDVDHPVADRGEHPDGLVMTPLADSPAAGTPRMAATRLTSAMTAASSAAWANSVI
jgi:hypothetical protein